MRKLSACLLLGAVVALVGCSKPAAVPGAQVTGTVTAPKAEQPPQSPTPAPSQPASTTPATPAPAKDAPAPAQTQTPAPAPTKKQPEGKLVADPAAITVMVNKTYMLPAGYRPADLVEPNVPFIFKEKDDKRLMRKEAAQALEQMFAAAKKDGVSLAGVSGFRSYETQTGLFNYYVQTEGEEHARMYSAEPGHSEHQTGLTMDVSGTTGQCAADDCFADTPEAKWLASHVAEYGFIIRYPKGKESVTGYAYEPWHVRYVGKTLAKEIAAKGITLEEYFK